MNTESLESDEAVTLYNIYGLMLIVGYIVLVSAVLVWQLGKTAVQFEFIYHNSKHSCP